MTPDTHKNTPESSHNGEEWVSVADAAQLFGVSVKTIWRRAKAGEITARKVAGARGGFVWEIAAKSSGQSTDRPDNQTDKPTGQNKQKLVTHEETNRTSRPDNPDRPTGQPSGHGDEMAARLLSHLETENAFLRGVIEQLQRDGAETRAALRKALDNAPRQLTSGEKLGQVGTETATAPESPIPTDKPNRGQRDTRAAKVPETAPESSGAGLTYGDLADMLEKELGG